MDLDLRLVDPLTASVEGPSRGVTRLGLVVPLSGPLGITGPSAVNAASLAAHEVNRSGGVRGRALELVLVDGGGAPDEVARRTRHLVDGGLIDAVVGLHTSDVHRALERALEGGTAYVFTPPHEGGGRSRGVVLLGDSPSPQLAGALRWVCRERRARRWALVGSDYIWPWSVHAMSAPLLRGLGADVVLERLVPFGLRVDDVMAQLLDALRRTRVEAMVVSLVGSDQVAFNRAFAESGLGARVVRVSGALEENGLLAAGGDDTGELYAAMRSFAGQQDERRLGLADGLAVAFGPHGPVLDAYAEGCYDGVHLAAALAHEGSLTADQAVPAAGRLLSGAGPRAAWRASPLGPPSRRRTLARADGVEFEVVSTT